MENSTRLSDLLRQALRSSPPFSSDIHSTSGKEVHQTANRILATSAKGTSRWSRAILCTAGGANMRKHKKVKVTVNRRLRKPDVNREKSKLPVVERNLKALRRLVPGCRKLFCGNILEETRDYIAALEMQVRAMTAITELLAG